MTFDQIEKMLRRAMSPGFTDKDIYLLARLAEMDEPEHVGDLRSTMRNMGELLVSLSNDGARWLP